MRNVALSLRKRRQKRHARHTSYFWVSLSLRCIFLSSSRDNFAARIFASIFATCNEWALLHWKDQTWILNRNFYFLICFFASRYFALRILQLPLSCIRHTGPGQSRGEFQLCFNVNVKLFLYFNSTLSIFFSPRISLFTVHSAFDLCRRETQDSNRYWSAVDCHLELHVSNNHCVDSNHSLFSFDSLEFRFWLKMEWFAGIVWRCSFFPWTFVWSEGLDDGCAITFKAEHGS